ncbi:MAG: hypothetical protein KGH98_03770, partial [Candidatus Micrarchaeota archaeon]|nr:hypothetical protein [Candidatus Micrarchaeota archaeon]
GRSRYSYYKLVENGIIKRVTISMDKLSKLRIDIISIVLKNTKMFFSNRAPYQYTVIEEVITPNNRYAVIADTGVPDGFILVLPVHNEGDREELEERFRAIKGMRLTSMIVSNVMTGGLCIRRFDNMYAKQYTDLVETHKLASEKPIKY